MMIEVYSPTIRRKEMDAVLTAMVEDKIGPGEQARLLIQGAKEHLGFEYCLALRSPALALFVALKALNLEDGAGVLITTLSPRYYLRVLEDLRLVPVYCDVAAASACITRETIEAVIRSPSEQPPPCCMVLHHTLGFLPDMASIVDLGLPVIEDCSRSYGTGAETSEASGVFTILGLEERDMLTAGGGALLYAANRRDASVLRNFAELPAEYGLPDMNAAMAVVQFREGARNLEKRKEIAQVYIQSALRTRHKRFMQRDEVPYNNYAFPLILESGMKDVKAYAKRKEIGVESAFEDTLMGSGMVNQLLCPESYSLSLRTVLFPLYPRLRVSEIERVTKLILSLP
ncbi:MAG: DegT/DnrJ/EryC1/StrS family aminotransferase [Treponema sp.]|jgi:dTDP-4-amino-4,6-dideoxygalactose transaminase|nr:DegT/DnrJ/EryC1/StrS family aminotransferase [Treponema sp.]